MRRSIDIVVPALCLVWALCSGIGYAQNYPSKPVRIVTTEAGSGGDFAARLVLPGLRSSLGQPFIVDNRGPVAMLVAAKSNPDGHTLLLYGSTLWLLPFMRDNVAWDPIKDFSPITMMAGAPNILVVHPSLPVKTVKELIALAKSRPGELNYSSGLAGAVSHLSGELFKAMAGVNIVRVAYKGTGPALNALLGQQTQLMFSAASAATPHVKSGSLRALAVTSAQPSALLPDLPTVAASGLPGYESSLPFAMFAPAKTPLPVIQTLNREIVRILKAPEIKERFLNAGTEVVGSSPEQLASTIKSEMVRWGKVIKDAGIHDE